MNGSVYLIPTTLGDVNVLSSIPSELIPQICKLKYFIVENIKTTRRYLKKLDKQICIDELTFFELNKHTKSNDIDQYIDVCGKGFDVGVVSEAGCPGVADPGAEIVSIAHKRGIRVVPMVGPSSILMALMSSGFNGQSFAFNGYLPIGNERTKAIKQLENISKQRGQSQIFMETPFRNQNFLEDIISICMPDTMLCIATDITLETEFIKTKTIADWKKQLPSINKRPTMFVLHRF